MFSGELLRQIRDEQHMTRDVLFQKTGITVEAIKRWELPCSNRHLTDLNSVVKLVDALQCDIRDLWEGPIPLQLPRKYTDIHFSLTEDEKRILEE